MPRKLAAYVLAADPTWCEASVRAYYPHVERIVVSYDSKGLGWTGAPTRCHETIERLRAVDLEHKIAFCEGSFANSALTPIQNDTAQRQSALEQAGWDGMDWVIQIDTDEVLPDPASLFLALDKADALDLPAVEWPMRVLFRSLGKGQFLEVCAADGSDRFEYPGPIAVRPGVRLVDARRTDGRFLRPVISGDRQSLQICRACATNEVRVEGMANEHAIVHNSWARRPAAVRSKVGSWGHNQGLQSWLFYHLKWLPTPYLWRYMKDFHPFARGLWPALKPSQSVPPWLVEQIAQTDYE